LPRGLVDIIYSEFLPPNSGRPKKTQKSLAFVAGFSNAKAAYWLALCRYRTSFDRGSIGLVLIGMPGIEKRLARCPLFSLRIGFVHEFFGPWQLERSANTVGTALDASQRASSALAVGHGIGRGDHPDHGRQLPTDVNNAVVEAARESLVIGEVLSPLREQYWRKSWSEPTSLYNVATLHMVAS
jgi:hypothetical protein